ncbi:serine hydrolase-like protein 2 isoform X1 [Amyelois transitella]|uniref:serine hydrolase-like protein 2 isoform X1 n=1 Tax=Amyelois transitella TaxID=680683 RepID=UPI0029900C56|nr:serine hydrolase-like protein 2 isoform X1 [Amyelois transitella]XP_060809209.1 serine hydrolase-like protein 2 isoform X1 [Amyelois transitella]
MKLTKEWFVPAPWGNIAVISWGSADGRPALLVHGRQDSAATFQPLAERLPHSYYFVAVDLPGNGKSDPFPAGLPVWRYYYLGAIDVVVKHLRWLKFIYVGHSMGCELGLFFNAVRPGMITRMVHLDPLLTFQRLQNSERPDRYFSTYFQSFYDNYDNYNYYFKVYTKRKALEAVVRARRVGAELAELLLRRNLIALGDDHYRLSWDRRTADCVPQNFPNEYYAELFSTAPPSVLINMSNGHKGITSGREDALKLMEALKARTNMTLVDLHGEHDAHLTPDGMAETIAQFLEKDLRRSKL